MMSTYMMRSSHAENKVLVYKYQRLSVCKFQGVIHESPTHDLDYALLRVKLICVLLNFCTIPCLLE